MAYSSVMENWMRVKIMHSIAQSYYAETRDSEYRKWLLNPTKELMFSTEAYDWMRKESCIVGMLMVWSVVTLESLVNHVLAETISSKEFAIQAIEYPGKVSENVNKFSKSDLAKKLGILGGKNTPEEITNLADELSSKRNAIVHDKPFDYSSTEDGEEIEYYRTRGASENVIFRFEHLEKFYKDCKKICNYIEQFHYIISPMGEEVDFDSLGCS